jgi:hypothetical protein
VQLNPRGQFYSPGILFFSPVGQNKLELPSENMRADDLSRQIYNAQLSEQGFRYIDITNRIVYRSNLRGSLTKGKTSEVEILQDFWKKYGPRVRELRYGTISGYPVWKFKFDGVNTENVPIIVNAVIIVGAKEHAEIQIEIERDNYRPKMVEKYLNSIQFNPTYPGAPATTEVVRWEGSPKEGLPRTLSEMRNKWD